MRDAIKNEKRALAAGHISELPTKALDEYNAKTKEIAADITSTRDELDNTHLEAATALSRAKSIMVEGVDDDIQEKIDVDGLGGHFDSVSFALGNENPDSFEDVYYESTDDDYTPDEDALRDDDEDDAEFEPEEFERSEFDPTGLDDDDIDDDVAEAAHEKEQDEAEAEHAVEQKEAAKAHAAAQKDKAAAKAAAREKHSAEVVARLSDAQESLERLHVLQTAALLKITAAEKTHDKLYSAVEKENETEAEDMVKLDEDSPDYESALSAAASLADHQAATRMDSIKPPIEDFESARGDIKDAAKATADAIKRLSKITGREPAIAAKPKPKKPTKTKKSANRPGLAAALTLAVMARTKLRLSKLELISLVDQPAQATATCRLIKRAGARDSMQVAATAKFVKLAEGADPLAYFWAFTCTDETGAPYHDLQGDAIAPDAYIKAAEEFMRGGGGVDDMHDGKPTNRVAFAFPMDSDIASGMFGDAIGKQLKTSGLMIAIRPSIEELAKLRSGERTGVSIAGLGTREVAKRMPSWLRNRGKGKKKPGRYGKSATLTSAVDGHQHTLDLCAPASCWSNEPHTSHQTSAGAEQSHCHAWVYDAATGAITIAEDSGHTHTVDAVVSAETMAEALAEDDEAPCAVEESPAATAPTVLAISMRAPGVSTRAGEVPTVSEQEQSMPTPEDKIAEVEKRAARFEKMSTLTDAARAHFGKLSGNEAEAFLAKSVHEREVVLAEIAKADEVVWESPIDGSKYRKSDDVRLINTAKALAESVAKQQAAEAEAREATFAKRGEDVLKNFPAGAKKNLRGRVMKAINAEFSDPAEYEEAVTALKGMNSAFADLTVAKGVNPANDGQPESPATQLQQLVKRHATENKVTEAAAYVAVLDTAEGARLYAQQPVGRA